MEKLTVSASPTGIAAAASERGCASVAFTYNDPVIFAEYAIDSALACRERGVRSVAVTAGYITDRARGDFFGAMDAANVDLKAFTEGFYEKLCFARLGPVLDTLEYLRYETQVWFEVTTLLIPGLNDSELEIDRLSQWFYDRLGPDVPLHFTAFHPDYRLTEIARTPPETCLRARRQARAHGLKYVYAGNVRGGDAECTDCPNCGTRLITRDWYNLDAYAVHDNACSSCGTKIPGRFAPNGPGSWGRRRLPVTIDDDAVSREKSTDRMY